MLKKRSQSIIFNLCNFYEILLLFSMEKESLGRLRVFYNTTIYPAQNENKVYQQRFQDCI